MSVKFQLEIFRILWQLCDVWEMENLLAFCKFV